MGKILQQGASEQARAAGLKSLAEVSQIADVSFQTLHNWHRSKPKLFAVVVAGCASLKLGDKS